MKRYEFAVTDEKSIQMQQMNRSANRLFSPPIRKATKNFEIFEGNSTPIEFPELKEAEFVASEFVNP